MNTATYDESKLAALSMIVKSLIDNDVLSIDRTLCKQVINEGIRKLHDSSGCFRHKNHKFLGQPLWTYKALEILHGNRGEFTSSISKHLTIEHVIPVSLLINKLLDTPKNTELNSYRDLILRYSIIVIITREEDKKFRERGLQSKMPANWDGKDFFARYKSVGLYDQIAFS